MDNYKRTTVCRACLCARDTFTYFLFENVSPEIYWFCTSVQVNQDPLPKALCTNCYEALTKFSEFKQACILSQKTLLEYFNCDKKETSLSVSCDEAISRINSNNSNRKIALVEFAVKPEETNGYYSNVTACNLNHKALEKNDISQLVSLGDSYKTVDHNGDAKLGLEDILIKAEDTNEDYNNDLLDQPHFLDECRVTKKIKKCKRLKKQSKLKQRYNKPGIKLEIKRKRFIYTCEFCNKKFNHNKRFEAHKLQHEGKTVSIACEQCDKSFMTWSGLKRHNENEHTQIHLERLQCSTCGRICKSPQTLKLHQKLHEERKLFVCDVCGKRCTSENILKMHLETHKQNRERLFTCQECDKKFFTKSTLNSHTSKTHKGRRFICQQCNFPFTDKYNLVKHLAKHEGKKLYKCEICNNSYSSHSTLVEHKRIHSGERPYSCSFCPMTFMSKRRMDEHHRVHTGERPFKCGVCDHGFSQRGTLKRHMKVHNEIILGN